MSSVDRDLGIDTSGWVWLSRLRIPSRDRKSGVRYEPIDSGTFTEAMRCVPDDFSDATFIDCGCGKGRALALAYSLGWRDLVGVEFAPYLANCARKNMAAFTDARTEILTISASDYVFPRKCIVVYMFNPFECDVMKVVVEHLAASEAKGYVVYCNPKHRSLFDSYSQFEPIDLGYPANLKKKGCSFSFAIWKFSGSKASDR